MRLEQRHATGLAGPEKELEDEIIEEEEDESTANALTRKEIVDILEDLPGAQAEIARAKMWPWRYLGLHARVEDVLQYDDRAIYPRASSRTGPRYQAIVPMWYGKPVELVKPFDIKRKVVKGASNKKDSKLSKDTVAAIEADKIERAKRPKWVQDEPAGYIARGEDHDPSDMDCTVTPLFILPSQEQITGFATKDTNSVEEALSKYIEQAKAFLTSGYQNIEKNSTNYMDHVLATLQKFNYDTDAAMKQIITIRAAKDVGDVHLSKEELKRFEEGVRQFGSELRLVRKNVKSKSYGQIVRYYYNWKKTKKGKEIWGHFDGRRGTKRRAETSWTELADEEDDSAFDNGKITSLKRHFECKFCSTRTSRQWRRAPNIAPGATVPVDPKADANGKTKDNYYWKDKSAELIVALCQRCAIIWRRYAMKWEDPEEIAKAMMQTGVRAWKRKTDEDLLREYVWANELANVPTLGVAAAMAQAIGVPVTIQNIPDPKKKAKAIQENEGTTVPQAEQQVVKKKAPVVPPPPRPPTPPIVPQPPVARILPCAVCNLQDNTITCHSCKLTVHRKCYGVSEQAATAKFWSCDTCANDKSPMDTLVSFSWLSPCFLSTDLLSITNVSSALPHRVISNCLNRRKRHTRRRPIVIGRKRGWRRSS